MSFELQSASLRGPDPDLAAGAPAGILPLRTAMPLMNGLGSGILLAVHHKAKRKLLGAGE
jgi:hypothetical protein